VIVGLLVQVMADDRVVRAGGLLDRAHRLGIRAAFVAGGIRQRGMGYFWHFGSGLACSSFSADALVPGLAAAAGASGGRLWRGCQGI
jgi:hypothetical protein